MQVVVGVIDRVTGYYRLLITGLPMRNAATTKLFSLKLLNKPRMFGLGSVGLGQGLEFRGLAVQRFRVCVGAEWALYTRYAT